MAWLQQQEPAFLEKPAHLVVDAQQCTIYLTETTEKMPAYWVHCRGKMPVEVEAQSTHETTLGERKEQRRKKNTCIEQ
ncbi:hypothetical protein KSD_79600 [Ktedonobacter sp. SOSP1-85]|nr:hypothetical protein KSD_79600 [Ktedonobacter sp. SOSP1-85]